MLSRVNSDNNVAQLMLTGNSFSRLSGILQGRNGSTVLSYEYKDRETIPFKVWKWVMQWVSEYLFPLFCIHFILLFFYSTTNTAILKIFFDYCFFIGPDRKRSHLPGGILQWIRIRAQHYHAEGPHPRLGLAAGYPVRQVVVFGSLVLTALFNHIWSTGIFKT